MADDICGVLYNYNDINSGCVLKAGHGGIHYSDFEDDTAERILKTLLKQRNEVEFVLGDGWSLSNGGFQGVWSFVPESDADLAYLTKLMEG